MLLRTCLYVKNKCKRSQRLGYKCDISAGHKGKSDRPIINPLLALTIALNFVASINKNKKKTLNN